ncbi:AI-2E family transporter [Dysgonomonas sp. 25]|uniref:AI-2E family transporter n=1 Tax=Dysgonomonas sp. 25 TaxID=2302933 RepID=UPI0013D444FD|nr:AI-2E family transporter [Dysgonomonas sp. 25]NDV67840.1 AI-2E family transporter [Dysgonomonas sp. 25]
MEGTFKEKYWKYSLIGAIVLIGIIIFSESISFLSGFLGAITIYILVRKQMFRLTEQRKWRKSIAASVILLEVILCILVPTFLVIWLLIGRLQDFDLHPNAIFATMQDLILKIKEKTDYDLVSHDNISTLTTMLTSLLQKIVGEVSSFVMNSIVLLFVLYFMLISARRMESYIYDLLPFDGRNKNSVLQEIKVMVRSNAIGVPLLAVIQGVFATVGYYIFGTPSPLLFGLVTCFATIIPIVGTAFIWLPLALYMGLSGNWPAAIGLIVYSLIVISNVDNLFRFLLQKKLADTHPLITIFGVIIGLTLFGFWGVVFGPLLLSMFFLLVKIFKTKYLDQKEYI